MHYVDEGAGDPILLLHGTPNWGYLLGIHAALAGRGIYLSVVDRERFRREAQAVYEAVLPDPADRLLTRVWPRWIPLDTSARGVERLAWLERALARVQWPTQIIWGRADEVFDHVTFAARFKTLLPHAAGPHLVTGRHFLQEDSGSEIGALIASFIERIKAQGA